MFFNLIALIDPKTIKASVEGKEWAHKELYQNSAPYVFSIIRHYILDQENQKDLMQEIYAKIFTHLEQYDSAKGQFKSWIRRISLNECFQYLKSRKIKYDVIPEDLEIVEELRDLSTELKRSDIEELLSEMPSGYKSVFLLSVFDGYTHGEISKKLNISPETSRSQLTRSKNWARRHLANQNLKEYYGIQ